MQNNQIQIRLIIHRLNNILDVWHLFVIIDVVEIAIVAPKILNIHLNEPIRGPIIVKLSKFRKLFTSLRYILLVLSP